MWPINAMKTLSLWMLAAGQRRAWGDAKLPELLEWRNRQTHWTQNPAPFTGHEGSTPSSSTNRPGFPDKFEQSGPKPGMVSVARRAIIAAVIGAVAASAASGQGGSGSEPRYTLRHGIGDNLPGWLSLSGEFRVRAEGRNALGYLQGSDDGYALVRTRLDIGIQPVSWLEIGFQGQDSRAPGIREGLANIGAFTDGFDLRQAYTRIGGKTSAWSGLSTGRTRPGHSTR